MFIDPTIFVLVNICIGLFLILWKVGKFPSDSHPEINEGRKGIKLIQIFKFAHDIFP